MMPPAPLWLLVWSRLPELLIGVRWDAASACYEGDIDGAVFRMYESDRWMMVFETGRRADLVDYLARSNRLSRREVWAGLERARGERLELPAVIPGSGGYSSGPSPEALQYAIGGSRGR